ncbi:MAG TPA: LytTR family DNA-binding domain-containing protein [Bryobacteraceae bacterium]|nr:LytTR family DNA-binding domain-containing protein [Bryobacteraceae bacterium]
MIRTVIIDDERLARQRIRRMLAETDGFTVAAEFENPEEGLRYLEENQTDLLFLDVQMPGMDGFGLLEALAAERTPTVVFVTAYDEYALRAFEVYAFDYLLKPFDQARFGKTLERVRKQLGAGDRNSERLIHLLNEFRQRNQEPVRFAIKTPGRLYFVRQDEIDWMEAADNYVNLHVGTETHLIRETMNALEQRLDSHRFLRIHRSTIVNADRIKELRPWFHGEYVVLLKDGTELTLSRTYREKILALLGN